MRNDVLEILDRYHAEENFSGACLVRQGDDEIVHRAYGLAHRGFGVPNTVETRFDIASVTKIFTAAATMQLVDRDEIALDTRVIPFLGIEDTPIGDEVTVYHLLTHTSGIADDADEEAGEDYELLFVDKPNYSIRETRDFLPQCIHNAPVFAPGEGVRYNNVAFVLLGLIIEQVSGVSYRDYVRQHIFAPVGMVGADFCAMDGTCPNLAEHYKRVEHDDGTVEWRRNIYSYPPVGSPDGGATVTARDLDRFVRAIRSGALMSTESAEQLLRPHVKRDDLDSGSLWNGFAFEFTLDGDGEIVRFGKDGINAGVASFATWFPGTDTTCVLLANQDCDVWAMQRELNPIFSDWYRAN
jgi:CubicO group peptidase (beta-lactamase class C family)